PMVSSRPIVFGQRLRVGSHIKVSRSLYYHHGIYEGRWRVIHYAGLSSGWMKGPIARTTLEEFSGGSEIEVVEYENPFPRDEIINRAKSRLEEKDYGIFANNCEHFATWCVTGNPQSTQVRAFLIGGLAGLKLANLIEW